MKDLSTLLGSIPPSATLAVSDKASAMRAAGHDVIALAGGDPDFDTPKHIVDAAIEAMRNGKTHYPAPTKGIHPALEAIAAKMERENGITVNPKSDIVITPGGKWALYLALAAMINPGDEVLYLEPVWVSYPPMITLAGGVAVPVSLDGNDNFRITAAALEAKITPKTKAIMVTTPSNPTGRVMTKEEMADIVAVCLKHDLYCIADELYEKLVFDDHVHYSLGAQPGMAERTLTVNGLSKAYAMTGWRLGWLAGPTPVMKMAAKMHSQTVTSAATFTMHAAVAALNGPQDVVAEMCQSYRQRRDFVVDALNELPGIECASIEGAFYLFPKFTHTQRNSVELADFLLDKAGVAGTPGIAFGSSGEGHLRFSIATAMSDLERAVERIAKVATEL
ncbi:MAG: pyridoxal phosphate-dependent aminotransferase [Anaerolineales bacterium]|nr:pyridoxal phosphate-dependent aminotransferase [Anaerolineales bacterium]MCB8961582.1 pyridoxal phosphate-dependent aminotransferase [Ardenticatenales bacterium]